LKRGAYEGAVFLAQSTAEMTFGSHHRFEIKYFCNNSTGTVVIKMDGAVILTFVGNTRGTDLTDITAIELGESPSWDFTGANADGGYQYWSDIIITNTAGSRNNDFIGDARIIWRQGSTDGTHRNGVPSSGSSQVSMINEGT